MIFRKMQFSAVTCERGVKSPWKFLNFFFYPQSRMASFLFLIIFFKLFTFMYMGFFLSSCMSVHHTHVHGGQKMALDALELELYMGPMN